MRHVLSTFALVALLGLHAPVQATPINSATGLASPATELGFDGLGAGVPVTDQFASQGVVLTPTPAGALVTLFSDVFVNMSQFALNQSGGAFQIRFQGTVAEAAFALLTNSTGPGDDSVFTALLNGAPVEQFNAPTSLTGRFFGFTGITFDAIEVLPGGQNRAFRLDNLQFGALTAARASEPLTLALLGAGLAGVAVRRRRRA